MSKRLLAYTIAFASFPKPLHVLQFEDWFRPGPRLGLWLSVCLSLSHLVVFQPLFRPLCLCLSFKISLPLCVPGTFSLLPLSVSLCVFLCLYLSPSVSVFRCFALPFSVSLSMSVPL